MLNNILTLKEILSIDVDLSLPPDLSTIFTPFFFVSLEMVISRMSPSLLSAGSKKREILILIAPLY